MCNVQVLYTDPVTPRAGEAVTVFYNPDITVLRGRPEIYLRGSWNRYISSNLEMKNLRLNCCVLPSTGFC